MRGILLLGAGGHARVVADALLASGEDVAGFLDDDPTSWGTFRLRLPVLGAIDRWADHAPEGLLVAIGANRERRRIVEFFGEDAAPLWCSAVHPKAIIASSALIGAGTVVLAGAVINAGAVIGAHAIVNTGAIVEHDCRIGDYAHVAPGSVIAGGAAVEEGAFCGAGSVVIPERTVGAWSTVGAGGVVVRNIPEGVVAAGVPARVVTDDAPGR